MKIFKSLSDDERLIAQIGNLYKLLCKYEYEELTDCLLNNDKSLAYWLGTGSDKTTRQGGVKYYNYMFQDAYKSEEDYERKKDIHYDKSGQIYGQLSIREAIERYGMASFGDFIVPPEFLAYVKECYKNGEFGSKNIPNDEKRFNAAKEVAEELLSKYQMPSQSVIAIIGALWVECNWAFDKNIINTQERDGGGLKGTSGVTGAGECWFGLTFWEQKKQVIKASGAPCETDTAANYAKRTLGSLNWDWQCKILYTYFDKVNKKWGKILCDKNGDPGEQIVASYAFKAGHAKEPTLKEAIRTTEIYKESHKRVNKIANPVNGFALQVFISMKFALFLKNKQVPKDSEVLK